MLHSEFRCLCGTEIRDARCQYIAGIVIQFHIGKVIIVGKLASCLGHKSCPEFTVGFFHIGYLDFGFVARRRE